MARGPRGAPKPPVSGSPINRPNIQGPKDAVTGKPKGGKRVG